jgi:hypothetical protein
VSFLTGQRRALFLVLAARIVPETVTLDAAARARMLALVEDALSARPVAVRRELAIFLRVLQWVPALRYGRPLDRLDALRQDAALRWFQDAPLAILRSGFWGVKTLVYLGYYGRPELGASIGYRPAHDGNRLLRHTRE